MLLLLGTIALAGIVAGASGHFVGAIIAYIACALVFYVRNSQRPLLQQLAETSVIKIVAVWPVALFFEVWWLWNDPSRYRIVEDIPSDEKMKKPGFGELAQKRSWREAVEAAKRAASQIGHNVIIYDDRRFRRGVTQPYVSRTYHVTPDGKVFEWRPPKHIIRLARSLSR